MYFGMPPLFSTGTMNAGFQHFGRHDSRIYCKMTVQNVGGFIVRYGAHVKRAPTKRKKPTSELNPTRPHMHIKYRPSHSAITENDATIVANEYNKGDKSMAASDEKAFCTLQTTPASKNAQERQYIFEADKMSQINRRIKSDDDTHIENNVHTL
jgi:hypothetical protein